MSVRWQCSPNGETPRTDINETMVQKDFSKDNKNAIDVLPQNEY